MNKKVWTFTNKISLDKGEFISYIEKKVFRTIRQNNLLPNDKTFKVKSSNSLNNKVLKKIISKKFEIVDSKEPNTSDDNLTIISEEVFSNILNGIFNGPKPNDKLIYPLYYVSDKEIELYAKLNNLKGERRAVNIKIDSLFKKFTNKNPDLELNIIKALKQIQTSETNGK